MALTPQNEQAFAREVAEELRREQLETFWLRYGRVLLVVLVVGLLALGAWLYWQHRQREAAGVASERFTQALIELGEGKTAAATPKLDAIAKEGNDGYQAVARLTLAASALDRGDTKAAVAQYRSIVEDASLAQPFRDLARVRWAAAEFDTAPPQQIIDWLKPLAVAGEPWFGAAGEMTALAYLKLNRPELAGPLFAAIAKDEGAPASTRSRALQMAGSLGVDAVPEAKALPKE